MKKRLIWGLLFCSIASVVNAQFFNPSPDKLYLSLIDEVNLLTLFVDTEDDYWEADEMEYYIREMEKAQEWLTDQAFEYEQELVFNNESFSENGEIVYIQRIGRGNPRLLLKLALNDLNYEDTDDFLTSNNFDFTNNKLKVVLFVKSNSRSHAYNLWSKKDVDLAIVFCRSTYGTVTDQYVIAHEMLHQFGAWDLYAGESQSEFKAKKAEELYPNSIMINTHYNKTNLEVDHLTAWRVGWHNEFEESFNNFIPVRTK